MKAVIISQARMTSTRLPGKVLREVLGKPLLAFQIERLRQATVVDEIIIATTKNAADDPIVDLCEKLGVSYYRGSEDDVLARFYYAASQANADVVIRVTSDCPLIDPAIIEHIVKTYADNSFDYVSNTLVRTYPRGMDVEIFNYQALAQAFNEAELQPEREHVTPFIYNRPGRYKLGTVQDRQDNSSYRWTVDTVEDFNLIKEILEYVYPQNRYFTMQDCLMAYECNPHWLSINAHIEQKKIPTGELKNEKIQD
jgi:spore coat polysaccharide biosynthesis protein SpsF